MIYRKTEQMRDWKKEEFFHGSLEEIMLLIEDLDSYEDEDDG